ncbi:zinc finger protein 808-like [Drosophila pseudoobscura]|uniref:Zinc finger protein 808-like n=1 Tax=Drosophila pseudoobscura pseudoobscura TaxID=46245 RepID=A0A6I8V465_DROPS|nr:zinc finger protein 808 [Drosophila pseudoobscura]
MRANLFSLLINKNRKMSEQCRCCANAICGTTANIFQMENIEMLEVLQAVSGINFVNDPGLPSCICVYCLHDLDQTIAFRNRIRTQANLLQQQRRGKSPSKISKWHMPNVDEDKPSDDVHVSFDGKEDLSYGFPESHENSDSLALRLKEEPHDEENKQPIYADDRDSPMRSRLKELEENNFGDQTPDADYNAQVQVDDSLIASLKKELEEVDFTESDAEKTSQPRKLSNRGSNSNSPTSLLTESKQRSLAEKPIECAVLKKKKKRRTIEKSFKCKACSEQFLTPGIRNRHERVSCPVIMETLTDDKRFKCKHCSKHFSSSGNRKHHERTHLTFSCEICGTAFRYKYWLKLHLSKVHNQTGEKIFQCDPCEKTFSRNHQLERHLATIVHQQAVNGPNAIRKKRYTTHI